MVKKISKKRSTGEIDYGLFLVIMLLLAIGIVMVYSASSYYAMFHFQDSASFLKKQLISAVLGVIAMIVAMNIDYHLIKKFTFLIMGICVISLVAVFFFPATNGAQRWIPLGPFSFQPSELAKYTVVIYLAFALDRVGEGIKDFKRGIVPYLVIAGFFAGLVLAEKNLSIASIIMIVAFIMLFVAGGKNFHMFGIVAPTLSVAALAFALGEDYRRARMLNFIDPFQAPDTHGYQLIQSFYALGSGGITGLGLGQSRQKTLYMPEPHNDFIFSIIGEELGLIGCIFIIGLFIFFLWRGLRIAMKAVDTYGMLLAIGMTSIIGVQAIINIAVVTGSMPVTGVPLPFISYGGTSIMINLTAMGVLLNISKFGNRKKTKLERSKTFE